MKETLEQGSAIGVVPPLPLTTYTATWTARGEDCFWQLMNIITNYGLAGSV